MTPRGATHGPAWRASLTEVLRGEVRLDEPLAGHTTFGIGGPADLWFEPADAPALAEALAAAREAGVPVTVVGGGSNLLVDDAGLRGLVVHLPTDRAPEAVDEGDGAVRVTVGAGAGTAAVRKWALAQGLLGTAFLAGIPGSLGGAVQMNAGTRIGDMASVVRAVEVATPGALRWHPAADLAMAYRHAVLPEGGIVTRLVLGLVRGTPEAVARDREAGQAELSHRHGTQPRGRSAGSIFKNPPGDHAGRLIEACGLKGRAVGAARISPVHANFIVNEGGATAADVRALMRLCQETVRDRHGVTLEPEVRLLGES